MKKIDRRKHMKKKALLLLPLALMGIASCDVPNQWQNDAQSISVDGSYYEEKKQVYDYYVEKDDGTMEKKYWFDEVSLSYCVEGYSIAIKKKYAVYGGFSDYDDAKAMMDSDARDEKKKNRETTQIYKFVNVSFKITYKEGVAL